MSTEIKQEETKESNTKDSSTKAGSTKTSSTRAGNTKGSNTKESNTQNKTATDKASKKQDKEKQLIIYKSLTIILMIILLVFMGRWLYGKYIEYRSNKMYEQMTNDVNSNTNLPDDGSKISAGTEEETESQTVSDTQQPAEDSDAADAPAKNIDWNALHQTNSDIYAWIYIPDTKIDYPILQSADEDSYYLTHNLDGSKGYPGCIYTEKVNYKDFFDFNTIIYGHNMKNGAMFSTLHNFEEQDFFENNKYVYIYTEDETFVYEIYAAYTTDDSHILNTNDFTQEIGRESYLEKSKTKAELDGYLRKDVDVNTDSKIITLSTCTQKSDQRYLVQAVRLN